MSAADLHCERERHRLMRLLHLASGFRATKLACSIANAEHNEGADIDELSVAKIFVDEGPTMKRIMPRAKGRADRIFKRSSHITVVVSDN